MNTPLSMQEEIGIDGIHLLNRTIESFNGAAFRFETYYRHLEERVRELDFQLEKKNAELVRNLEEKEQAQNYLHNILESLTTGIIVSDPKGRITKFNRAAEAITGIHAEDATGNIFDQIFISEQFPELKKNPGIFFDLEDNVKIKTEILRKGNETLYVSLSTFSVYDPHGKNIGKAITIQDISQMRKLEEKAARSEKLAAMGEMAAEIAHEIRNPLGSIELFATTLKKDLEGMGELQTLSEHISSGVKSLNNIISNLLLFVGPQKKPYFQIMDISGPMKESLIYSKHLTDSNDLIEVMTEYQDENLMVHGDPELLKQAFMNIILNAIQAMPNGGRLKVSMKKTAGNRRNREGYVEIQISDTGKGVASADKSKIFDPFFTTKTKGTGLGLAIVYSIIKIHSGDIDIESLEGKGTMCTVTLPFSKLKNGALENV